MARADVLITATELEEAIAAGRAVDILDVRWQLSEPDGREGYGRGHLPGAVYVSLEDELSDHSVAGRGRHPLPTGAAVEAAARRWGLRRGVPTVVYDDWNRAGSARAWWVLTAAGIDGVRILDGGLGAWIARGGSLEAGFVTPQPGDVVVEFDDLHQGALPVLTADDVTQFGGRLLDARAPDRFRGDTEPVDPVAGHIPGAVNAPGTATLTADGAFLTDDALRDYFSGKGVVGMVDRVGVYCGSGVTAAVTIAALRITGIQAGLFPGSWSQWCTEPTRPVAKGG